MPASPLPSLSLRPGRMDDLGALVAVENACFASDRLSRRSFAHMLTKAHAALLVAEDAGGRLAGYGLVLFHAGTSLARLYSVAVSAAARGLGAGAALVRAAETAARDQGCVAMRLEVRRDNAAAIALYERLGYRPFSVVEDYYEDHMEAVRYEKRIVTLEQPLQRAVPYYRQTTEFTCGPACLLMAMRGLDPGVEASQRHELNIWREATSIFMATGHGGCGPLGLALAAWRRGFAAEVWVSARGPLFRNTVRDPAKKQVIAAVHEDFTAQVAEAGIAVHHGAFTMDDAGAAIAGGGVPLILVSQYRMTRHKAPHWMVLTGYDDRFVYAHDPDVDEDAHKTETDCVNIPFARQDFARMARYGAAAVQAAVIVGPPHPPSPAIPSPAGTAA